MPVTSHVSGDGKAVTIRVAGQFTFSVYPEFREATRQPALKPDASFVIDLTGAEYMDSSALGMLLVLRERAGGDRANIAITHCSPEIRKILSIANFDRLFRID